ncbi:FKBP-type peptidyl-prolyl cis-trans isomerase [Patescibacteria group bacterium]|nr:FKBP-type peptidyl-prolyl cis-trans isomerase [Patescibacteria group bacterium]
MKYIAITIALAAVIIGGVVLLREKPEAIVQENPAVESYSSVEIPDTVTSAPEITKPSATIKNNITIKNGMTIETTKQGTGEAITNGKVASMLYTGMLDDGTVFDSTSKRDNTPFEFTLGVGQVIKGWDQGVLGMKVGEERTLVIPAELAYGSQGAGGVIPPNATLTFTVTLLAIK